MSMRVCKRVKACVKKNPAPLFQFSLSLHGPLSLSLYLSASRTSQPLSLSSSHQTLGLALLFFGYSALSRDYHRRSLPWLLAAVRLHRRQNPDDGSPPKPSHINAVPGSTTNQISPKIVLACRSAAELSSGATHSPNAPPL